ncbi:MAG: TM2 domain-containing protein [Coriobacteriales bacterium]|jgi:TM2 domain-containing membrane protein YozV|nr:TM2 domain-containing protein [Coriobacteriales bacterium]
MSEEKPQSAPESTPESAAQPQEPTSTPMPEPTPPPQAVPAPAPGPTPTPQAQPPYASATDYRYPPQAQQDYQQQGYQQQGYQQQGYQYASQPQPTATRTRGIGSPQKDKWVAALLAFVLGCIGIHKFYLGYKTEGIIMIIVSTVGSICLGLGPLVMFVISLIEAVRYLILTQEDFERVYVQGYQGWF